jgi:hypothetical protein
MLGVQREYSTKDKSKGNRRYDDIIEQVFQNPYKNMIHNVHIGIKSGDLLLPSEHFDMETDPEILIQKLLVTSSTSEINLSGFPMNKVQAL